MREKRERERKRESVSERVCVCARESVRESVCEQTRPRNVPPLPIGHSPHHDQTAFVTTLVSHWRSPESGVLRYE
jgi:hypothetical protein